MKDSIKFIYFKISLSSNKAIINLWDYYDNSIKKKKKILFEIIKKHMKVLSFMNNRKSNFFTQFLIISLSSIINILNVSNVI